MTETGTVGWGIIGIGGHAESRMAPAINRAANARLAAVCSRSEERAKAFAAKHGAEHAYDRFEAMLADPAVEVVYIGSPNGLHAEHTIACARAGKHVLCDKPMATTAEDCQSMIEACRENGVQLAIGYNQRYQPAHQVARELFASGELGQPVMAKAECAGMSRVRLRDWWYDPNLAGAGSLMSMGSHAIDLLRYILGREVEEVVGLTDAGAEGIEELAVASLRFEGGMYAQLDSSRRLPWPSNDIAIHASNGYLKTTGTIVYDTGGRLDVTTRDSSRSYEFRPPKPGYDPFTAEVEWISRAVRGGGSPKATGEDGLEGVRVIQAIQESAKTGRSVRLQR